MWGIVMPQYRPCRFRSYYLQGLFSAFPRDIMRVVVSALLIGVFWFTAAEAACHNKRTRAACAAAKACAWDKEKQQCY
jgi:hypothetical protein